MKMNFLNFEYFLAIRQAGTIRQAAEVLYISPQALSENLGKLEKELGTALFHRTTPLTLTSAGELFARCAQDCLESRRQLELGLNDVRRREERLISLGIPTGMAPPLLLAFEAYFRRVHPEYQLSLIELPTRTGALAELPGHIDGAMGAFSDGERLHHIPIVASERFVVAAHRDLLRRTLGEAAEELERAARDGELVELSRFRDCPFILKRAGSVIRTNEDRIFREAGFEPSGTVETGDLELSVRYVLLGEAAIYLPEPMARANFFPPDLPGYESPVLLCPVRVEGERWELTIAHPVHSPISRGMEQLVEAARQYYSARLGDRESGQRDR